MSTNFTQRNENNHTDILNKTIQYYEIKKCILELNKDKAYGPDMIHNQMLINGGPPLWSLMHKIFNNCLQSGTFPQLWNYAVLPIPKRVNSM